MRQALYIIILAIVFIFCVWGYEHWRYPTPLGDSFILINSRGDIVTEADIRERPAVIFFGYTMCPDVCPMTLLNLSTQLEVLGTEADKIGFWFFTVDPERDTPQVMHDYIANFSDKILGISGDPEKVRAALKSFNIFAEKVEHEDGYYTYDHTSAIILLNKGGFLRNKISYQEDNGIAIERLKNLAKSVDK